MTSPDQLDHSGDVSGSTDIAAPPSVVFDILSDPTQHAVIDGSGSVKSSVSGPDRLSLGSTFGMSMKLGAPYRIKNTVVEFEPDRVIAWRHFGQHRWRYELEPTADGTRVTETWDVSRYPGAVRKVFGLIGFPERNRQGIEGTLVKLKAAAELRASTGS